MADRMRYVAVNNAGIVVHDKPEDVETPFFVRLFETAKGGGRKFVAHWRGPSSMKLRPQEVDAPFYTIVYGQPPDGEKRYVAASGPAGALRDTRSEIDSPLAAEIFDTPSWSERVAAAGGEKEIETAAEKVDEPVAMGMVHVGRADTVGELIELLDGLPRGWEFGFRNQPMQHLYVRCSVAGGATPASVVFQNPSPLDTGIPEPPDPRPQSAFEQLLENRVAALEADSNILDALGEKVVHLDTRIRRELGEPDAELRRTQALLLGSEGLQRKARAGVELARRDSKSIIAALKRRKCTRGELQVAETQAETLREVARLLGGE